MLVIDTTLNSISNNVSVNSPSGIAYYSTIGVIYIGDNSGDAINVITYGTFALSQTITNAYIPVILEIASNGNTRKLYFSNEKGLSQNIGVICLPTETNPQTPTCINTCMTGGVYRPT